MKEKTESRAGFGGENKGREVSTIRELLFLARDLSNPDSIALPCSTSSALCAEAAGQLFFRYHFITEAKALLAPDVFNQIMESAQARVAELNELKKIEELEGV